MSNSTYTEQGQLQSNPKIAFSEKLEDLREALDVLYISKNPSGRNKFREKWPIVAQHIFGDTLIKYDNEGTENLEDRKALEESAELRRIELKKIIAEFEALSVDSGFLKLDYIGALIDKLGIEISVLLYSEKVIERSRPGLLQSLAPVMAPTTSATPTTTASTTVTNTAIPSPNIIENQGLTSEEKQSLQNNKIEVTTKPHHAKNLPPKGTLKSLFNWRARDGA